MDKRDVLVSDIRVTAIGENGQYIFDWVDQEEGKVEFLPSESDYDDFDEEVERALNQNGVYVEQEQTKQSSQTESQSQESKKVEETGDDGGGAFEPVGSAEETSTGTSTNKSTNTSTSTPTEAYGESSSGTQNATGGTDDEGTETHSFIVRMSDASERREVIRELQSENAKNKMELTGPYKVTYEVQSSGELSLVRVEDLGIGSEVEGE